MKIEYTAKDMDDVPYSVETAGPDQPYSWMVPGVVYDFDGASDEYGPTEYTPAQARAKAAALLRAADEAEGREPVGALAHIMAVLDMQYDADEIAEDPSILTQIRADAERMVRMVRNEVADELWSMDGTNMGMSLTRAQAVNVARRGLTPGDVQGGS